MYVYVFSWAVVGWEGVQLSKGEMSQLDHTELENLIVHTYVRILNIQK